MKVKCKRCKQIKDASCFSKVKSNRKGYSLKCKDCINEIARIKNNIKNGGRIERNKIKQESILMLQKLKGLKECKKCGIQKDINDFQKSNEYNGGYKHSCRECVQSLAREKYNTKRGGLTKLRKEAKEKELKTGLRICSICSQSKSLKDSYSFRFYGGKKNKETRCKSCKKAYFEEYHKDINNKEAHNNRCKSWRKKNPDRFKSIAKKHHKSTKHQKWLKQYTKTDKYKQKRRDRNKKRRSSDIIYDMQCRLSKSIQKQMKAKNFKKSKRISKILGCTGEEFTKHIEGQFTNGMSWDNRNEWHLDHIIPKSTAKTKDDVYKLNHYTNFQPLWAEDNLKKGNRLVNP